MGVYDHVSEVKYSTHIFQVRDSTSIFASEEASRVQLWENNFLSLESMLPLPNQKEM
jgi:hypothetical protein